MPQHKEIPQNTDRIARKLTKAPIYRQFVRAILSLVIARRSNLSTVSSLSPLATSQDRKVR